MSILLDCILLKGFLDKRTAASFIGIKVFQVKPFKSDDFPWIRIS